MAIKYRCDFKDIKENQCRIDISKESYSGDIIAIRGVKEKTCILSRDCDDDPYTVIVNTKASLTFYQQPDLSIDISELQQAQDREFRIVLYVNSEIKFSGFLIPDGIQQTFQSAPFELNINATDGLMLLSGIKYQPGSISGSRNIISYLRDIFFSSNHLNLMLPIKWVNTLTNDEYPLEADIFSGSLLWSARGEGFTDYNGTYKDCMYILDGMLRSMQSRIVQSGGKWVIWRINDVTSGSFIHRETPATTGPLVITTSEVINEIKTIGKGNSFDYNFIQEDAILTINKALKTVATTYSQDQRDNILPNGNLDIVIPTVGLPLYWGLGGVTTDAILTTVSGGLGGGTGNYVDISNGASGGEARFEYDGLYLPIDSDVLYNYINFGFKFSIINGYVVDSNGFIVWDSTPFKIRVWYFAGAITYYLNENGFWTTTATDIQISIPNLKPSDVAQVDFNAKQNIILPLPSTSPIGRTTDPSLYISFLVPPGRRVFYDDIYVNTDSNSDVYEAVYDSGINTGKEDYTLNISTSHNGFYVSNFMSSFSRSGVEKFFSDSKLSAATLTEMTSHAILRNRYKSSTVFEGSIYDGEYNYDEIYNIETLTGKNFLPLRSSWNTETCITSLSMVEIRDDGTEISISHYGSNNKTQLSN